MQKNISMILLTDAISKHKLYINVQAISLFEEDYITLNASDVHNVKCTRIVFVNGNVKYVEENENMVWHKILTAL